MISRFGGLWRWLIAGPAFKTAVTVIPVPNMGQRPRASVMGPLLPVLITSTTTTTTMMMVVIAVPVTPIAVTVFTVPITDTLASVLGPVTVHSHQPLLVLFLVPCLVQLIGLPGGRLRHRCAHQA
jgi:hypothetical protein